MRIWYQSFVDEENGAEYWRHLRAHLAAVADEGTEITVHGITPYDSYAHAIVEMRCAREVVCNAVRAEREGYDAFFRTRDCTKPVLLWIFRLFRLVRQRCCRPPRWVCAAPL